MEDSGCRTSSARSSGEKTRSSASLTPSCGSTQSALSSYGAPNRVSAAGSSSITTKAPSGSPTFTSPEDDKTKLLVLDGQQRLQSLFIGLKGSYEKRELYFDVLSGDLVAPEDIRYKFKFLDAEKAAFPWVKFKEIVFSNEHPNRIARSIRAGADRDLTEDEYLRIEDNVARIWQQFSSKDLLIYQELDSVDNPNAYNEDDVVEIFIRANSGGTRLGKSDLLFSSLTSSWEDADERMDELLDDLNRVGYDFTATLS